MVSAVPGVVFSQVTFVDFRASTCSGVSSSALRSAANCFLYSEEDAVAKTLALVSTTATIWRAKSTMVVWLGSTMAPMLPFMYTVRTPVLLTAGVEGLDIVVAYRIVTSAASVAGNAA